jgi:hypothetical protein
MRLVLLHYHIFKNAGSTIEEILEHSFGDRFAKHETAGWDGLISNTDMLEFLNARSSLRAFSSHQIRHPLPQVPGYLFFDICFLRDPIDRIRSIYFYFRRKPIPMYPISDLANRYQLGDFVAAMIQEFPLFVTNVQVNLLACGGHSDDPNTSDLEVALQRVHMTAFLGVVDCFDQSAKAGAYALRCAFPDLDCDRPPVHVFEGMAGTVESRAESVRQACRPEVFEELLRLNDLDRQLVDQARKEVMRRFSEVPETAAGRFAGEARPDAPRPAAASPRRLISFASASREIGAWRRSLIYFLGRQRHLLFDAAFYLNHNPDVGCAGANPLVHYARHGAAENRKPLALFDPVYYRSGCPDEPGRNQDLLRHFLDQGRDAANPHPLFDCQGYLAANPGVSGNPLVHYLLSRRAGERGPAPHVPELVIVLVMEIDDVSVTVICLDGKMESRTSAERLAMYEQWKRWVGGSAVAMVWQGVWGRAQWIAEPQQEPFLRAVRIDQVHAQVTEVAG